MGCIVKLLALDRLASTVFFSNVSSKRFHERMHNHIGCICLAFLQCGFSNDSSNCLPERRHSHTGRICFTPLCTMCFQMHPQITCPRRCIIALAAFVWLFSTVHLYNFYQLCVSKCVVMFLFRYDVKSHWLHLCNFTPLCFIKCVLKLPAWADAKSQLLHLFGFSPLCVFKCALKLPARAGAKSHWLHLFDFCPLCK